jgi:hypothetical protein
MFRPSTALAPALSAAWVARSLRIWMLVARHGAIGILATPVLGGLLHASGIPRKGVPCRGQKQGPLLKLSPRDSLAVFVGDTARA